jgi:methionyl-tRNA formyltransferase
MIVPDTTYILLASPPIGDIAARLLQKSPYPPAAVITDTKLTTEELIASVHEYEAGMILVVGYGRILKQELLDSVAGQVLNIHPSLLPAYRGPAPVVQTLLDGVIETGVSLMEIDALMDHGPIIAQTSYRMHGKETATELYELLTYRGVELFLEHCHEYLTGELEMLPQAHHEATRTYFVKKEDGLLSFDLPAVVLERKVRAYVGWPGTWLMHQEKRLLVHAAHVGSDGTLVLDEVQPEGRKRMTLSAYANGLRSTPEVVMAELLTENTPS